MDKTTIDSALATVRYLKTKTGLSFQESFDMSSALITLSIDRIERLERRVANLEAKIGVGNE